MQTQPRLHTAVVAFPFQTVQHPQESCRDHSAQPVACRQLEPRVARCVLASTRPAADLSRASRRPSRASAELADHGHFDHLQRLGLSSREELPGDKTIKRQLESLQAVVLACPSLRTVAFGGSFRLEGPLHLLQKWIAQQRNQDKLEVFGTNGEDDDWRG